MKVKVYWNLTKKTWSIKDAKTGLVIGHDECVHLINATFEVQASGRDRVRREKKKYVHAYVVGYISYRGDQRLRVENPVTGLPLSKQARYNPYENDTFVDRDTGECVESARIAILQDRKVYYN